MAIRLKYGLMLSWDGADDTHDPDIPLHRVWDPGRRPLFSGRCNAVDHDKASEIFIDSYLFSRLYAFVYHS